MTKFRYGELVKKEGGYWQVKCKPEGIIEIQPFQINGKPKIGLKGFLEYKETRTGGMWIMQL